MTPLDEGSTGRMLHSMPDRPAADAHPYVDEVEYLRLLATRMRKDAPLYEDIRDAAEQLDAFADSIESRRAVPDESTRSGG